MGLFIFVFFQSAERFKRNVKATMIPAARLSNIYKNFGALQALKNINFDIDQNTYLGLFGPNGAGKSTLINIMGRVVARDKRFY